jgi:choline dehydrogenase-like flavoprotein
MPDDPRNGALAVIDALRRPAAAGADGLAAHQLSPEFQFVRLGVRVRTDWQQCVKTVVPGLRRSGPNSSRWSPTRTPTARAAAPCLQGCPTNAGKSTLNTCIHPPWAQGTLELRADCDVRRVTIADHGDGPEVTGVEYVGPDGTLCTVAADVVVVAAGALATPGLLIRSGVRELSGGGGGG